MYVWVAATYLSVQTILVCVGLGDAFQLPCIFFRCVFFCVGLGFGMCGPWHLVFHVYLCGSRLEVLRLREAQPS